MVKIIPPTKIFIAESKIPKSGRGVFAAENISKGEVIEEAPILILKFEDFVDTRWNLLFEYYFWMDKFVVLALGYASLYNHSLEPNITYKIDKTEKLIRFTSLKDIKKGEELLFNYKGTSNSKTPLWFER
jgi:uncharacterized protein